ncbi:MAG: Kae1-associated serine/threonine protein kinase [Prevotella sp.]|nr:Kae1-associated serine/threonine protein kinase [Prevotella sp.]
MNKHNYDSSASGYVTEVFEGVSQTFTDIEMLHTSEVNVVAKAKRYGRWWLLKGLRREVASEAAYQQRLRKELEIMMMLQHTGIVSVAGMELVDGFGECIVMEYVDGQTLKQWLQGTTTRRQRRNTAHELAEAVGYIHSKGIVHRDLKPENIMITGNGGNVKLVDFGLADTDSHTVLKQPAGTPRYMSPEQMQANVADVRNDIYSLGVILDEMNLGYGHIVRKCLLPLDKRYKNVTELLNAIQAREKRRTVLMAAGIAFCVVILAGLVGMQTLRLRHFASQTAEIHNEQAKLESTIALLNDSINQMSATNRQLTDEQERQNMKRQRVEMAIKEGKARIDKAVRATGLKQHLDTLSNPVYLNTELYWETFNNLESAYKAYTRWIAAEYTESELSEITYRLMEYHSKLGNMFGSRYDKIKKIRDEHERKTMQGN